ncbi:MAG: PQQ-dependent sugar dehydrogenase, partial [Bdellovibrionales bacterium]|nr:PQQ-dependent sugar dehydrogenase [Bdellovibrionales bacterium]
FLLFILVSSTVHAYKAQEVYKGNDVLWSFDFVSPIEVLISHRNGEAFYFNLQTNEKVKLSTPTVKVTGQGGLLDIHYLKKQSKEYVYYTYSEEFGGVVTTSLARGIYSNKEIKNLKGIFRAKVKSDTTRHFGSRLAFKEDYIFMSVGDRGERHYAQDLNFHNGKILRLKLDGSVPPDNPYITTKGALPEIWSYGHRNPQGLDFQPQSGELFSCEFGPLGGDELNLIKKSKNYGWPVITYGREYYGPKIGTTHKPGMEQPLTYWVPSISPSGMAFYQGDKVPEWKNNLFLANLSSRHLRRLKLQGTKIVEQNEYFKDLGERIRHVRSGLDGYLYFSTDSGKLFRVLK